MNVDYFRRLYSYTDWANEQFFECIRGLSEEQYTREMLSSFPNIRDTLGHVIMADWLWLRRWKGESPSARPDWWQGATVETLTEKYREVQRDRAEWLDSLTDDDLQRELQYRTLAGDPYAGRLADLLAHVVNHATYHRGQLTTMLRQVGVKPPSTDFVNLYVASLK